MAIKLKDFLTILERDGRYGVPANLGVAGDQPTLDLLAAFNLRSAKVWARADWKWKRETISFAVVPGTTLYSVSAVSGNLIDRILDLIPNDPTANPPVAADPLDQQTVRDFFSDSPNFIAGGANPSGAVTTGMPTKYCNIGQDANGKWQVILNRSPERAFTMSGFAKPILTTYTVADVAANATIQYFPNAVVLDCLYDGCMSNVMRIQGNDAESARLDTVFNAKINQLAGDQIGVDTDNTPMKTPMPDRIQRVMNQRLSRRRT